MISQPPADDGEQAPGQHQVGSASADAGDGRHGFKAQDAERAAGSISKRTSSPHCDGLRQEGASFGLAELLKELRAERLGSTLIERAFFAPKLTERRSLDAEYERWRLLQFASLLPPAPFDEALASQHFYSKIFREHSDRGLAELEAKEKPPSAELAAFRQLQQMGIYDESVFYSPAKANHPLNNYTNELDRQLGPNPKHIRREILDDRRREGTA